MLLLISDLIIMELYKTRKGMSSYEAQCKDFLFVLVDDAVLVKGWVRELSHLLLVRPYSHYNRQYV